MNKIISKVYEIMKNEYIFIVVSSIFALFSAYFFEYALDLDVCSLCVYQRFPYAILIPVGLVGLYYKFGKMYFIVIFTLLVSLGLSGYHALLEAHLLKASSVCNKWLHVQDLPSNLIAKALTDHVSDCSRPAMTIMHLSITEWNFVFSLVLLVIFIILSIRNRKINNKDHTSTTNQPNNNFRPKYIPLGDEILGDKNNHNEKQDSLNYLDDSLSEKPLFLKLGKTTLRL